MAVSTTTTSAAALEAFVREFSADLISKGYYGNRTAGIATPHAGVKGKKVLTELALGTIGRRWSKTFAATGSTINFKPRTLEVEKGTFEIQIDPQDFYDTYLGRFHAGTFNNTDSYPFEAFIMEEIMKKQAKEIEDAWWRGDKAGSPASTDPLMSVVNGWLTLITDDLAANTPVLTPVTTSGGSLTTSNTIQTIETMWDGLNANLQDGSVGVFVSPKVWSLYQRQYRNDYGKYTDNEQNGRMKLDFCDAELIRTPGMGTSSRILMTPVDNLHYGFDGIDDWSSFNFQKDVRSLKYWSDFLFGVQFGILEQGFIVVNDLA